jgi:hypothetical protein
MFAFRDGYIGQALPLLAVARQGKDEPLETMVRAFGLVSWGWSSSGYGGEGRIQRDAASLPVGALTVAPRRAILEGTDKSR